MTDSTPSVVFISVKGWQVKQIHAARIQLGNRSRIRTGESIPNARIPTAPLILVTFTYDETATLVINYPASIGGSVGVSSAGITFTLYVCNDQCNNTYLPGPNAILDERRSEDHHQCDDRQRGHSALHSARTVRSCILPFTRASANVAVTALLSTQDTSDALSDYARFVDTITPRRSVAQSDARSRSEHASLISTSNSASAQETFISVRRTATRRRNSISG